MNFDFGKSENKKGAEHFAPRLRYSKTIATGLLNVAGLIDAVKQIHNGLRQRSARIRTLQRTGSLHDLQDGVRSVVLEAESRAKRTDIEELRACAARFLIKSETLGAGTTAQGRVGKVTRQSDRHHLRIGLR